MFKRVLSFLAVLTLLFSCAAAETATMVQTGRYQIEMKEYPYYFLSPQTRYSLDVPLYFVNSIEDVPFINVADWAVIMTQIYTDVFTSQSSKIDFACKINYEANQVIIKRENDSFMICDFKNNVIAWTDYDAFFQNNSGDYLGIISTQETDASGQPYLLQRVGSSDRHGEKIALFLSDYGIPMIAQDEKYLVPLQTLSAFCLSGIGAKMYFNGQCLIFANVGTMKKPDSDFIAAISPYITDSLVQEARSKYNTEIEALKYIVDKVLETEIGQTIYQRFQSEYNQSAYKLFLSGQSGVRSPDLAKYGYHELCLELDSFYGLKSVHSIESFDSLLSQNSLKDGFLSTDALTADNALDQLIQFWLDDGHSGLISYSSEADSGQPVMVGSQGQTLKYLNDLKTKLDATRNTYPESKLNYYEVGNTAYVTFDEFTVDKSIDYYSFLQSGNLPTDTISLIAYAHKQITRENSPIENVVLDLSNNGGGLVNAAVYVLGWFLGDANVSVENMFSGAQTTATYRADVNLDHVFDENDTISNLNLYCLISPMSFSCGNLVPWAFRADGRVTLIGKTSGGGSCLVAFSNTAWGTSYRYSGQMRVSFVKNGSFYDVDQGVVPDSIIRSYDHFYDREALTEFINSLY